MLGDFITRVLVMLLGYAYPAFECFKTVEKNRADIEQLRFWCQYWIIVATLTVIERIGDVFVSWLPMYGEFKLAFFLYLWYPRTKGTNYVYETFLRPYVAKHETEIDHKLQEFRARAWDMAILYWQNFASQGQMKFFEFLQYLAKQSPRPMATQGAETPTNSKTSIHREQEPQKQQSVGQWQPPPPATPPVVIKREVSQLPKADHVVQMPPPEAKTATVEVGSEPETPVAKDQNQETAMEETLRAARVRLRRAHRPE